MFGVLLGCNATGEQLPIIDSANPIEGAGVSRHIVIDARDLNQRDCWPGCEESNPPLQISFDSGGEMQSFGVVQTMQEREQPSEKWSPQGDDRAAVREETKGFL